MTSSDIVIIPAPRASDEQTTALYNKMLVLKQVLLDSANAPVKDEVLLEIKNLLISLKDTMDARNVEAKTKLADISAFNALEAPNLSQLYRNINALIALASKYGGYAIGNYVTNVLIPLAHGKVPVSYTKQISLIFPDHESFFNICKDGQLKLLSGEITLWNQISYVMISKNIDHNNHIHIIISDKFLEKDIDINQLIAQIDSDGKLILRSVDPALSVDELQRRILERRIVVRPVCYEEARKSLEIAQRLSNRLLNFKNNGWTVDESAANAQ